MSIYPGIDSEQRFAYADLVSSVQPVFEACGMRHDDAALLATSLVEADLHGIHSHGVMRVLDYVGRLSAPDAVADLPGVRGGVNATGTPAVERDGGAMVRVNGDNSMGQIGLSFATDLAIERAREHGIAFVTVGNSNHCGALFWYLQRVVAEDMIGMASTNALPTMAPIGGAERIVGMNPLGFGIPAGANGAFLMDSAFAACARGKIQVYAQKGASLPPGWALDSNGVPTIDPNAALAGLIQPVGGYKGINVAMAFGVLSTLLAGAGYGTRLGDLPVGPLAGQDGHFIMVFNIAALTDLVQFKQEMDAIIDEVHGTARAPDADRVLYAGELELEIAADYRRHGIPLNDETIAALSAAAERVNVKLGL